MREKEKNNLLDFRNKRNLFQKQDENFKDQFIWFENASVRYECAFFSFDVVTLSRLQFKENQCHLLLHERHNQTHSTAC